MKYIYIIFALILLSSNLYGQKETYTWYFGMGAGMSFADRNDRMSANLGLVQGVPAPIAGPVRTSEGCFSISDRQGKFLFASDGKTVYNANLDPMAGGTGLKGSENSSQSGIVIPHPKSATKYFIITTPPVNTVGYLNGFTYSIVDMDPAKDGGLGLGVIDETPTTKNVSLPMNDALGVASTYGVEELSENMTVVGHRNGIDYWVVSKVYKHFLVWAVTEHGISDPIYYDISIPNHLLPVVEFFKRLQGCIKLSPDGAKVVHVGNTGGHVAYADFDPITGVISNAKIVDSGLRSLYGVEFSPNGKYVYLTRIETLDQTDPSKYDNGLFIRKIEDIGKRHNELPYVKVLDGISNVQLGADKRIYAVAGYQYIYQNPDIPFLSLWVILNPNEGGTEIAEFENYFTAPNINTGGPRYGLPPFITSYFTSGEFYGEDYPCAIDGEEEYTIRILQGTGPYEIAYFEWDFGDGSPIITQPTLPGVSEYKMGHKYTFMDRYEITVKPYNSSNELLEDVIMNKYVYPRTCQMIINPVKRSFYKPF